MRLIVIFLILSSSILYADFKKFEQTVQFSGRVSRLNKSAKLMRLRVRFENAKFFRKKDKVEFWNETYPNRRCLGYLEGRSPQYLLIKVPKFDECIAGIYMTSGTYLHLYSEDLAKGIEIGQSLVSILMQKKLALQSRMRRHKNYIDSHINRMDLINKRYSVLRQKLELEWKNELAALEEDKIDHTKSYNQSKNTLDDLFYKLEQYKVFDENLTLDRWSLDPELYIKK